MQNIESLKDPVPDYSPTVQDSLRCLCPLVSTINVKSCKCFNFAPWNIREIPILKGFVTGLIRDIVWWCTERKIMQRFDSRIHAKMRGLGVEIGLDLESYVLYCLWNFSCGPLTVLRLLFVKVAYNNCLIWFFSPSINRFTSCISSRLNVHYEDAKSDLETLCMQSVSS